MLDELMDILGGEEPVAIDGKKAAEAEPVVLYGLANGKVVERTPTQNEAVPRR